MSSQEIKFSHHFYLDFLSFMKYKFPSIYWGENEKGYYWRDSSLEVYFESFSNLQELVESISNILILSKKYD